MKELETLFTPLTLGPLTLRNRLVQGPLAGYSCAPFRVITERIGAPGFCSTEMISAKDLVHRKDKPKRYCWRDPQEHCVSYQLAANDCDLLARATAIVTEAGADIVDLNCGCPVKKIRGKGTGSKLLHDPELLYQLVKVMKANTDAAVSVKIRVGEPVFDSNDIEVAKAVESAGAHLLSIHGRHWTERYDVACRQSAIAKIVKSVAIPVFANGDARDPESVETLLQTTRCAGVMIARASVGDPWLFQRIRAASQNKTLPFPTVAQISAVFIEHIQRLLALENEKLAILQARKLAKYYSKYFPNRTQFVTRAQEVTSYEAILDCIHQHTEETQTEHTSLETY